MHHTTCCLIGLAVFVFGSGGSSARQETTVAAESRRVTAPVRLIILSSLDRRLVRLVEWNAAGARVAPVNVPEEYAADAADEVIPLSAVVAVCTDDEHPDDPASWSRVAAPGMSDRPRTRSAPRLRVTMVDGQRFIGSVVPEAATESPTTSGEHSHANPGFTLRTLNFGDLAMSLDDVASIEPTGARTGSVGPGAGTSEAPPQGTDRVVFLNGDRIDGFVESVGDEIVVVPEATGDRHAEAIRTPLDRVRSIEFANPVTPLAGLAVWVNDPSGELNVVRAANVRISSTGEATIHPTIRGVEARPASLGARDLAAMAPDASRIVPLSTIGTPDFQPGESRQWSRPPQVDPGLRAPLGLGNVVLPGAMKACWTLPAGINALAGAVELAPESRLWGDCKVSISIEGSAGKARVLWEGTLNAQNPTASIGARNPDPGARETLCVRVEPGPYGHVHNRVTLRGFMLVRD